MAFVWASVGGSVYGAADAAAAPPASGGVAGGKPVGIGRGVPALVSDGSAEDEEVGDGTASVNGGGGTAPDDGQEVAFAALPLNVPHATPHLIVRDAALRARLGTGPAPQQPEQQPLQPSQQPPGQAEKRDGRPDAEVAAFFTHLAVCNTVVPGRDEGGAAVFQATSPDEEALVQGGDEGGAVVVQATSPGAAAGVWGWGGVCGGVCVCPRDGVKLDG
eukprot:352493-Chlamydomonas_euryale.AAC.3